MPKTNLGKWSVVLIPVMFVLFFIGSSLTDSLYESVPAGDTLFADIIGRPALALSMLVGFGAGISALVTGLISILKKKERSLLVYASTIIGAAFTLFYIIKRLFPN